MLEAGCSILIKAKDCKVERCDTGRFPTADRKTLSRQAQEAKDIVFVSAESALANHANHPRVRADGGS